MARHIKNIIELTRAQTKEFLLSLSNPKNARRRKKTIKEAQDRKFNLIL